MKRVMLPFILSIIVASLLFGACAQTAPQPPPSPAPKPAVTAPAAQSRQQALQELYSAAKAEGEVLWQVPTNVAAFKPVIEGFASKFPGIKVSPFLVNAPEMPTRIIAEAAAGKLTVDLASGRPDYLPPLLERDLLASPEWQKLSDVDPSALVANGRFISLWHAVQVFMYNTKSVTAADAPKSFQDLLLPKWKGRKIGVSASGGVAMFLFGEWQKDKQKARDILTQLRQQDPFVSVSGLEIANRVASGEVPIGWTTSTQFLVAVAQGAPLALSSISPTYGMPIGGYIPKNSPHPNAAKLLLAWLSSKDAQPFWAQTTQTRATEGRTGKAIGDAGIKFIAVTSEKDVKDLGDLVQVGAEILGGLVKK